MIKSSNDFVKENIRLDCSLINQSLLQSFASDTMLLICESKTGPDDKW